MPNFDTTVNKAWLQTRQSILNQQKAREFATLFLSLEPGEKLQAISSTPAFAWTNSLDPADPPRQHVWLGEETEGQTIDCSSIR